VFDLDWYKIRENMVELGHPSPAHARYLLICDKFPKYCSAMNPILEHKGSTAPVKGKESGTYWLIRRTSMVLRSNSSK
jgi:hypothetical protein